ncbi:MAG: pyridoxal-phosphate dependent enzyme [Balneolaceae bacterium]|nr:pyridoxal-phosphate dependent enzyme [Balneolaceae bacterium]
MKELLEIPSPSDIDQAYQRIRTFAHRTPVLTSNKINERVGSELFFKCENLQRVGAFKFRGACNAIFSLPDHLTNQGVATHSSGNHAQAVALAARLKGVSAHVVMPENAPTVKVEAVRNYGANVTFCTSTLNARESTLKQVVADTGAMEIHPYNNKLIVEGQSTASIELLEEYPDLDIIVAPVGGGGLLSGTALATKYNKPNVHVVGTEPENADDAYRSFHSGTLIPVKNPDTIADGLRTSLGELPFRIISNKADDIVTVSEAAIIAAMRFLWERMNIIIEPSSAVPLAAIFEGKIQVSGKKTGIILTGGNVDLTNLPWQ